MSFDELVAEIEALWVEEAERRLDELEQGQAPRPQPKKCFAEPGLPSYVSHNDKSNCAVN